MQIFKEKEQQATQEREIKIRKLESSKDEAICFSKIFFNIFYQDIFSDGETWAAEQIRKMYP